MVDLDRPFEAIEGGYNITVIEGGRSYLVFIPEIQLQIFEKHGNTMVVAALRVLADSKRESD